VTQRTFLRPAGPLNTGANGEARPGPLVPSGTVPAPELVVMAAGLGSRFGGLKQLEPVGPSGEALLDYAVFDAVRAGVERVIFVIRREMEREFHENRGRRYTRNAEVVYAFQVLEDLPGGTTVPSGRTKPWGTAHAVYAARAAVRAPFVVINADDFYGPEGFALLAGFLAEGRQGPPERYAMVAYRLRNTLSLHGSVARGVCETDAAGFLVAIREYERIESGVGGPVHRGNDGERHAFAGDELVSMNLWGFRPGLMAHLEERFRAFLDDRGREPSAEFYLPAAVGGMIADGLATVRVFETEWPWFGLTHREDVTDVKRRLLALVEQGVYPARLWG